LTNLDRYDEATRALSDELPEMRNCMTRGSAADRTLLSMGLLDLAFDRRDADTALQVSTRLTSALSDISGSADSVGWDTAARTCNIAGLLRRIEPRDDRFSGAARRLVALCQEFALRAANGNREVARLVSHRIGEPDESEEPASVWLEQQIDRTRKAPRIGELGFDESGRAAHLGDLLSQLGFKHLWSASPDLAAAGKAYADSYALLQPLASPRRPKALTDFSQLVIRISHYNSLFPARAIVVPMKRDLASLVASLPGQAYERYPSLCEALNRLDSAIRSDDRFHLAESSGPIIVAERNRCIADSTRRGSHIHRQLWIEALTTDRQNYGRAGDSVRALLAADRIVRDVQLDTGFPRFAEFGHEVLHAFDARAHLHWSWGNVQGAYADWMSMVSYAEKKPSWLYVKSGLRNAYAAHMAAWPDKRGELALLARRWLDASVADLLAHDTKCANLNDVLKAGQSSAESAIAAGTFGPAMKALDDATQHIDKQTGCRTLTRDKGDDRVNEFIDRQIVLAAVDLRIARQAFQFDERKPDEFELSAEVIERETRPYREGGINFPNSTFPLTSYLIRVANLQLSSSATTPASALR
jgi:hypothetical protein